MKHGTPETLAAIEAAIHSSETKASLRDVARHIGIDSSTVGRYADAYPYLRVALSNKRKAMEKEKGERIKAKVLKQLQRGQWSLRAMSKEIGEEETAVRTVVINNGIGMNKLRENRRNMRLECAAMTVKAYESGEAGISEGFYLECKQELTGQSC